LAGEFTGRLPYEVIDRVIRRTWQDVDGRIATEELGEMLHRLARSRLYRILDGNVIQIPQSRCSLGAVAATVRKPCLDNQHTLEIVLRKLYAPLCRDRMIRVG